MRQKHTGLIVGLLAASLLFAVPFFAQTTQDAKAQAKAAAEAKKLEEKQKKEEEKKRKAAEKAAEKAAKEAKNQKNSDIENIGNRDINKGGGLRIGTPDLEKELAIGRGISKDLESQVTLLQDKVVTEYVNRVGQNIVKNSDAKIPFTIKVIDSDEINALSLPGGFFYVNTGLIMAADEEAELAAVMGHEIAHVTARHAAEQMGSANLVNILSVPAVIFGGGIPGAIIQNTAAVAIPALFYKYGRSAEEEADRLGLQYMYKAGYDPGAAVTFFEKLQARESAKKRMSSLFSSHPPTESRVIKTKANIEFMLPPREQYLVTTSEFDQVKTRLVQLQDQRNPSERERAPSLIRRTPSRRNPNEEGTDRDGAQTDPADREPDPDAPPVLRRPQDRPQ
jgi:hypothetical protein